MKIKVGLVGVDQICFTGDKKTEYENAKNELKILSNNIGFDLYCIDNTIITRDQAEESVRELKEQKIDFILIQNSSYAAGETLLPLAKMGLPIGLWAVPEPSNSGTLPLNSFCGSNMYSSIIANYLKEYKIKYKWFFGHANNKEFIERIRVTVKALTAIKRMRLSKVALVGGIAPGFNDLYFDERLAEKRLGVNIQRNHEYSELKERALAYKTNDIADYIEDCKSGYCKIYSGSSEKIEMNARFLKAYIDFVKQYKYDAVAISCWPKIQDDFGISACQTIAKLNALGIPASCEGDIPGAISMLLLKYISDDQITTLMDLVAFDEKDDTLQLWHCGPTAMCFADSCGVGLKELEEATKDDGRRYLSYIHDMNIKPGDATVMCVAREFSSLCMISGSFIDYKKERFNGSAGWLGNLSIDGQKTTAKDAVNTIMVQGIQHHFPVVMGDYSAEILELCAWLGIKGIKKVPYESYLQLSI